MHKDLNRYLPEPFPADGLPSKCSRDMPLFKPVPIRILVSLGGGTKPGDMDLTVQRTPSGKLYICKGITCYCFDAVEGEEFEFLETD